MSLSPILQNFLFNVSLFWFLIFSKLFFKILCLFIRSNKVSTCLFELFLSKFALKFTSKSTTLINYLSLEHKKCLNFLSKLQNKEIYLTYHLFQNFLEVLNSNNLFFFISYVLD